MKSGKLSMALATLAVLTQAFACGDTDAPASSPEAIYVLFDDPTELAEQNFWDHPFPSDFRMTDGAVRYQGFYNPYGIPILTEYIDAIDGVLEGFSPVAAGHLRFTEGVDPSSLPADPDAAMETTSSVQLIDVDPNSPERGVRKRINLHFQKEEGVYWRPNTLAFMPAIGFPLRPATKYALVVTDDLKAASGAPFVANPQLRQVLSIDTPTSPTAERFADGVSAAVSEVEAAGVGRAQLVHLAVFTTNDPTLEVTRARDLLHEEAPPPEVLAGSLAFFESDDAYDEYHGDFGPIPNFQVGKLPFRQFGDGGGFDLVDGVPQIVDYYDARFSLSVPNAAACPMPSEGYPIVLYAHGTGGNYRSVVHSGVAAELAGECLAVMGVDQIFHGTRPGAPENAVDVQLLFFNFQNIEAGRTNGQQSGLDEVQRARLFTETQMVVPASIAASGTEIRFNPEAVMFYGHSQGGLNGPVFMGIDDGVRGGVLSGASSVIAITLLEKVEPQPAVANVVRSIFLGLKPPEYAELNIMHPPISMAQAIVDAIDPINYAYGAIRGPRDGFAPKSVLMTEGVNADGTGDSYAPVRGIEALALGYGLPLQQPVVWAPPDAGEGLLMPTAVPADGLRGNLAGGKASGILAQWSPPVGEDGHFVVFDVPAAGSQAARFLRALADDPVGNVPAP